VAKNAGNTVQALLARAPAPPRPPAPTPSTRPTARPDPVQHERGTELTQPVPAHAAPAPAIPVVAAPAPRQHRTPAPASPSAPDEPPAPPTLRLSQPIAQALRSAWLTAKRDRVLLTYQDFAGEIIATGLWPQHSGHNR
jgi:hypothetical protein